MSAMVGSRVVADPPLVRFLFADTRLAPLWLVIRLYVGSAWVVDADWHKVTQYRRDDEFTSSGKGILALWQRIAAFPAARAKPAITYDRYRGFIGFMIDNRWEGFFGKLIAFGETSVGRTPEPTTSPSHQL